MRRDRVVLLLVLLGLAWRLVWYGMDFPLWGDEARLAVSLFDRGPRELLQPLDYLQIAPVLFLWGEWAVAQVLGLGEMALRLLPVVAGILSLFVVWRLARATLDPRSRVAAVALFAASYYPVRHATEVKPYSLDLLFGAWLLLLGWRVLERGKGLPLFAATAIVSVWFSYPAAFVAGGVLLVLAWRSRRDGRALLGLVVVGLGLLASFGGMLGLVGGTQADAGSFLLEHSHWERSFPPRDAGLPLWLLEVHTGNLFAYPNGGNRFGSAGTFFLVLAGVVTLWRSDRRRLLALLLSPFPLMFVAAWMGEYPYGGSARIAQHVAPSICLLAGVGVVGLARTVLGPRRVRLALRIWVVAMVLVLLGGLGRTVAKPHKHAYDAETRRVVEAMGGDTAPGERWIVFGALAANPRAPTLPRVVGWRGWGGDWATVHYYLLRNAPGPLLWAPEPVRVEAGPPTRLIRYRDNHHAFPEAQYEAYLRDLEARLGPAGAPVVHPLRPPTPMALEVRAWPAAE